VIAVADGLGTYTAFQSASSKKSAQPQLSPSPYPTPSLAPSPTLTPTPIPTSAPTTTPTAEPTLEPTLAPTPSTNPTPTPTATPTPTPLPQTNATETVNWAGYVVASNFQTPQANVTGISASWVVPKVSQSSTSNTYSAIWIGIGGQFNDTTLIQCGTEQDSADTNARYYAWYELLPNSSIEIPQISVLPGDHMQASIQLENETSSQWVVNITDTTQSQSFQSTFTYHSSQLSAEWIIERPTIESPRGDTISELTNFGTVNFTNCSATIASVTGNIASFPWEALTMYTSTLPQRSSIQLTDVSELNPGGSSFTINWLASG
jgi:hypothetical protein